MNTWSVYTDCYGQSCLVDDSKPWPNNLLQKRLGHEKELRAIAKEHNEALAQNRLEPKADG